MSEGLPDLVSHVRIDTSTVAPSVGVVKAELGGLSGATSGLEKDFKGLLSSITGLGPGTSALSGYFSSFAGAGGKAKDAMAGVKAEGGGLAAALPAIGVGVAGLGVAVGGFAVASVGKFISVALEVNKLKTSLGSSAEDASRLRNVAVGLGVDMDALGKGVFKLGGILEKSKGDLAGVHVEIAKNKDGSSNLVGTIDNLRAAYQGITDPIQRDQFLLEAFKKTGLELRPILSATAELFNKLANTGPPIHQADIDRAKELVIAQRELKQKLDDVQVSIAQKVIPGYEAADHRAFQFFQVIKAGTQAMSGHFGDASRSIDQAGHAFDKNKGSAQAFAEKEREVTAATQEAAKAFDKLVTAQENFFDKGLALERAQDGVTKAMDAEIRAGDALQKLEISSDGVSLKLAEAKTKLHDAIAKYGEGSTQAKDALQNLNVLEEANRETVDKLNAATDAASSAHLTLKDALITAAKATRDKKEAEEEAAGQTVSAKQKVEDLVAALREQAAHLAPGSELRTNLEAYANQLANGIPKEVHTTVSLNTDQANASLDQLQGRLAQLNADISSAGPGGGRGAERNAVQERIDSGGGSTDTPTTRRGLASAMGNVLGVRDIIPLAAGGRTSGFVTDGPRFLVGEGNPSFPEVVVPTDPQFHDRAVRLTNFAAHRVGLAVAPLAQAPLAQAPALRGGEVGVGRPGASPGEAIDYDRLAAVLRGSIPVVLEIDGREFARTTAGDMSREFYTRANSYR